METCIGFEELCWMAAGRPLEAGERAALEAMSQAERNDWVLRRAAEAGDVVATEERRGTDGAIYRAFWIVRPPGYDELVWSTPRPITDPPDDLPPEPGVAILTREVGPPVPRRVALVRPYDRLDAAAHDPAIHAVTPAGAGTLFRRWAVCPDPAAAAAGLVEHLRPGRCARRLRSAR